MIAFKFQEVQQAYNAIAVSRQMKLLALNSSNKARESSNSEKPKEEEVNPFFTMVTRCQSPKYENVF